MDVGLPGGWHVTVFYPWGVVAVTVLVLIAAALVAKLVTVR